MKEFSFPVSDDDFMPSMGWCKNRPKCVVVAMKSEGVAVRDSKLANSPTLFFTHEEWTAFTNGVKDGEFA